MALSFFLAKMVGLTLIVIAGSLLINRKNIDLLFSAYRHPESVLVTGVAEVILGLSYVLSHNIWTWDFRGVLTVIGWVLLLRGLERTLFASRVPEILEKFRKMHSVFSVLLIGILGIGIYLAYSGFVHA